MKKKDEYYIEYNNIQKKMSLLAHSLGVTETYLRKNAKYFNLHIRLQVKCLLKNKLNILKKINKLYLKDLISQPVININSYKKHINL